MSQPKKRSIFSFIWPYLILSALMVFFIVITMGSRTSKTEYPMLSRVAEILYEEEVVEVTVTPKEKVTAITGTYVITDEKTEKKTKMNF